MKEKIRVTNYNYSSPKLPSAFNKFTIVQLSDLHECEYGDNNQELITMVKNLAPSIIVITGDLVDSKKYKDEYIISLAQGLTKIAPTYYVSGNHEAQTLKYLAIKRTLSQNKVIVLDDKVLPIKKNNQTIYISGLLDISFNKYPNDLQVERVDKRLSRLIDPHHFNILLSHRPEYFAQFVKYKVDLVLCGHTHAGQIRVPLLGAIYVPQQGLFPKYDYGKYNEDDTTMIISAGLGCSRIGLRLFNKPEIVVVTFNQV